MIKYIFCFVFIYLSLFCSCQEILYLITESCDNENLYKLAVRSDECVGNYKYVCNDEESPELESCIVFKKSYEDDIRRNEKPILNQNVKRDCDEEDSVLRYCSKSFVFDENEYCIYSRYFGSLCEELKYSLAVKTGTCITIDEDHSHIFYKDKDYIYEAVFDDGNCYDPPDFDIHPINNGISECIDAGTFSYQLRCNVSDDKQYKYTKSFYRVENVYEDNKEFIIAESTSTCKDNQLVKIFENSILYFTFDVCNEDDIEYSTIFLTPLKCDVEPPCTYATNMLSTQVNSFVLSKYDNMDDCNDNIYTDLTIIHDANPFCGEDERVFRVNNTHYNYTDTPCSSEDSVILQFGICYEVSQFYTIKAKILDVPNIFQNLTCNLDNCVSKDIIILDDITNVNFTLIIGKNTTIKFNLFLEQGFVVIDDGFIKIDGGSILFELSKEELKEIVSLIESDKTYEFAIINGLYEGTFDSVTIKKDESQCENLKADINYLDKSVNAIFTVDKSNCSKLKWWMILLICLGALIIVTTVVLLFIKFNKSCRSRVLPYHKS